jgi:hypothetical protein
MKYLKFEDFCVENASLKKNDGILFIVDVQSEFDKFIPKDFEANLNDYCEEFKSVYQVWDSNKSKTPTYKFKKQVDKIEKQFGIKKYYNKFKGGFDEWIFTIVDKKTANNILTSLKKGTIEEGTKFKLENKEEYLVYIDNAHTWFYVNDVMARVFKDLKGKSVVIVGGADDECLRDVYVALESFGLFPIYNHEYIYSAKTSDKQVSNPS